MNRGRGGGRRERAFEPEVLVGPGTLTATSGFCFVISDELGDIAPGPTGLIVDDTRHLSAMRLRVDGRPLRPLGAALLTPAVARHHSYVDLDGEFPDPVIECERTRTVSGSGFEEELVLRSWSPRARELEVELDFAADFADIFEMRAIVAPDRLPRVRVEPSRRRAALRFLALDDGGRETRVRLRPVADEVSGAVCRWRLRLGHGEAWRQVIAVRANVSVRGPGGPRPRQAPRRPQPRARVLTEPDGLEVGCRRALDDLDRLSIPDTLDPSRRLVAAGIPWFVALFGRDAVIASHQARVFMPGLMLDTLHALAARQGRVDDPGNEEQPGKILHEVRLTERPWLGEGTTGGDRPYYGSVDATPLFLILYGEAWRWGAPRHELAELLPAARAALRWMRDAGDPDGDGLIEYQSRSGRSLRNQGWKDSENAIQFADGELARGPIALVEVQGYAYRARRELASVLAWMGAEREADELDAEAATVRALVRERYWRPGTAGRPGYFALALDGEKRPVDAVASNMGHLLWSEVPDRDQAAQVAAHLTGAELASGWGVRTLSSEMAGFNPISYHLGSVWPHDTVIACEGLRRYGLDAAALGLASNLLDALAAFDHRLPELFGGQPRESGDIPVPYPTACRPQAWAAGAALSLVPLLLGLEVDVPGGVVSLAPALPPGMSRLEVSGIPLPSGILSLAHDDGGTKLIDVPDGMSVRVRPRPVRPGSPPAP